MSEKEKQRRALAARNTFSNIIFLIQIATCIALLTTMFALRIFPAQWMLAIIVVLILIVLVPYIVLGHGKKKGRLFAGTAIVIVLSAAMVAMTFYLGTLAGTLKSMSGSNEETTKVGVFVLEDSKVQAVSDLQEGTFGILERADREDTDQAMSKLEQEIDSVITVRTYEGVDSLVNGLLSGECNAIVMNAAFLDVISELEEYADLNDRIREIDAFEWIADAESVLTETSQETAAAINGHGTFAVYISGIDVAGDVSLKCDSVVNILAVVNTNTKQILLISTPRDYYVPLSASYGVNDKLRHTGIYGIESSKETLEMLYDTNIDYYFRFNFNGLDSLIDALGGITVQADAAADLQAEGTYLNGAQALAYARGTQTCSAQDRQNDKNQMDVLEGVMQKLISFSTLRHLQKVLACVPGNFETNMGYGEIATLIRNQLSAGETFVSVQYDTDGTDGNETTFSLNKQSYVVISDTATVEQAKTYIQAMRNDEVISVPEE